jgi:hypothetical protein
VEVERRRVRIIDVEAPERIAEFNDSHLYLQKHRR